MSDPIDIFADDDEVETGQETPVDPMPRLPRKEGQGDRDFPEPATVVAREEAQQNSVAAGMRQVAVETGYAAKETREKTVYDFDTADHKYAKRKTKTFDGNPETVLKCFDEFCRVYGKDGKTALYEAFRLLGEQYDFKPLASLPDWKDMRTR